MKTFRIVCGNVDSCQDGESHLFPDPGEQVTVREVINVREVGTDWPYLVLVPGQYVTVTGYLEEAHEVTATFPDGTEFFLAIDGIAGLEGSAS